MTLGTFCSVAILSISPAKAVYIRADTPVDQYNAIGQLPQFASAAYFRFYNPTPGGLSTGSCSGTLFSPTKILTAAHCFDTTGSGTIATNAQTAVGFTTMIPEYDPNAPNNIASIVNSPLWSTGTTKSAAVNDIAIVTLINAVTDVAPAVLFGRNASNAAAFVGYGSQGIGTSDGLPGANNRLGGYNTIDVASPTMLQFDFDSPDLSTNRIGSPTPLTLEGSVAGGDSGSGLFAHASPHSALMTFGANGCAMGCEAIGDSRRQV